MLSCESTVRPPTSPIIQLFGRGFGQPASTMKLGAVAPAAGLGAVFSARRSATWALASASAALPAAGAPAACACADCCAGAEHAETAASAPPSAPATTRLLIDRISLPLGHDAPV